MRVLWSCVVAFLGVALGPLTAQAMPTLQLYVEGGSYNTATESWDFAGDTARLWVIGQPSDSFDGKLSDVRLSVAYPSTNPQPTVTLTGSTTGGYGGFADPSVASNPTYVATHSGDRPTWSDGQQLAPHGIYGAGTDWQEYKLGDMTLSDSLIADFQGALPSPVAGKTGQINVYTVNVAGVSNVHFDVWGTGLDKNGKKLTISNEFSPFSHDADYSPGTNAAPELTGGATGFGAAALVIAAAILL